MINIKSFNEKSILSSILRVTLGHKKNVLTLGYIVAGLWLTANAALAWYSFNTPVPQPQATLPNPVAETFIPTISSDPAASLEDVALLRDPFANLAMPVAGHSASKVPVTPSGLRLQGIILSVKNGIVLEAVQSGAVYFLSEGQQSDGILVNNITKTSARIEVNGNRFDISISGEKE